MWQVANTYPTGCGYPCTFPFQYINNDTDEVKTGMKTCEESVGTYKSGKDHCYCCMVDCCWNSQDKCLPICVFSEEDDNGTDGECDEPYAFFLYNTVTLVYDPSRDYCYKDKDNARKYCWCPTDSLPSGNYEGKSGRAYNDCGEKCNKF